MNWWTRSGWISQTVSPPEYAVASANSGMLESPSFRHCVSVSIATFRPSKSSPSHSRYWYVSPDSSNVPRTLLVKEMSIARSSSERFLFKHVTVHIPYSAVVICLRYLWKVRISRDSWTFQRLRTEKRLGPASYATMEFLGINLWKVPKSRDSLTFQRLLM